jgi:hypothetical protein
MTSYLYITLCNVQILTYTKHDVHEPQDKQIYLFDLDI